MKVHLMSVDSPRAIAGTMQADCGAEVQKATEVYMFDEVGMGQRLKLTIKGLCKDCYDKAKSERYTYGISYGPDVEKARRKRQQEQDLYI